MQGVKVHIVHGVQNVAEHVQYVEIFVLEKNSSYQVSTSIEV